ncbi:low molecular weight phosphatase family protein [Pelagibius sp. Alg239-R121]|uniref:arsenate-mycothiol transferase ArsC n=1 Tax=Pelagibius sp. Alg239-R121 TaxID=2993448 RepID=UPI0024A77172|nr:hypothetical protein [Pelagibius sp. Alg239-R121]
MYARQSVLFICSGNIFRSMSAEYALKAHIAEDTTIAVASAGLNEATHEIIGFVRDHLRSKGIDISAHRPTQLTPALLDAAELPVAMGMEHRELIERNFGRRLPLFSEVAYGTEEALRDVWEVVPDWRRNEEAAAQYGCSVIDYIHDGMPGFLERMSRFINTQDTV